MSSRTQQALQIFGSIQRDAEDCYHVILLYSSFLKYLPFHSWYYSHAFNFIVYLDPR